MSEIWLVAVTTLLLGGWCLGGQSYDDDNPPENRIIGGDKASLGEFPFMASLRRKGKHHCGAAIINENHLLTAAHCIENLIPDAVQIKAGFINEKNPGDTLQERNAARLLWPTQFNVSDSVTYDIAMVKVTEPFEFNEYVNKIDVPEDDTFEYIGDNAIEIGWGLTSVPGYENANDLHKVTVPTHGFKKCKEYYGEYGYYDSVICAGPYSGGKDSCKGDSGGPLVCPNDQTGGIILCGIITGGISCAIPTFPGLATSTAYMHQFIKDAQYD